MTSLYEKYRPSSWAEVIGQDKVVGRLRALESRRGLAGRAYWLSGGSGTGKTTIARLIAASVADEFFVEEIDATALTVAGLTELERSSALKGWSENKPGRAYLVNEAHGLRRDGIRQLLVVLERIPAHVVWAFTTTSEGQERLFDDVADASPLLSRCINLPLAKKGLADAFAVRLMEIGVREGLGLRKPAWYKRVLMESRNNFRTGLQVLEAEGPAEPADESETEAA